MRIKLDNVLLCILWLLAVTLGACFWFNTVFGFNIFSGAHWEYISSLQATKAPIKTGFYVSIAATIFITIFGLYLVLRPNIRRIKLPIMKINKQKLSKQKIDEEKNQENLQNNDASTLDILPAETQPEDKKNFSPAPSASLRPPRLVLPTLNNNMMPQPSSQVTSSAPKYGGSSKTPDENAVNELKEIFTNLGYTVKRNPRVNGIQTALVAIGTNEVMWLGCIGVTTIDVRKMIDKFQQIFSDTLDETEIEINGFAIAAPDASTSEFEDIMMFNDINELKEYMKDKQNPLISDDDGMFDAYSQYIDAVITHIGMI